VKLSHEKRQTLEAELAKLYEKHGHLAADVLVKAASKPRHPLHDGFGWVWDDVKAASIQRLDHARRLIASVRHDVIHETAMLAAPVYIHDPRAEGQGYVKLDSIKDDRAVAIDALKTEISRALRYIERARAIAGELELNSELRDRLAAAGVHLAEVDASAVA
jgi:hypothetical protein